MRGKFPRDCPVSSSETSNAYEQWFTPNAAQRGTKKPRIDDTYANTGPSDARTPIEGAIRPQSYREFSGYANTVSDNQVMGQSGPT